ncbi:MAG: TonB family protein [Longimonas sp.]|uniref:TonB family protein n=1 Tax=Longimonas sp. TaxID=2039626 RepID=UPI003354CAE4
MFNCPHPPTHSFSAPYLSSCVAGLLVSGFLLLAACTSTDPQTSSHEQLAAATAPPTEPVPEEAEVLNRDEVDQEPLPAGGMMALYEEVRYPDEARRNEERGRVRVQFVVGPKGTVYAPEIVESATPRLDNEVLRVITTIDWEPGIHNDEPVFARMTLPVTFDV